MSIDVSASSVPAAGTQEVEGTLPAHMKRRNIDLVLTAMWLGITGFGLLGTGRRVAGTHWRSLCRFDNVWRWNFDW